MTGRRMTERNRHAETARRHVSARRKKNYKNIHIHQFDRLN